MHCGTEHEDVEVLSQECFRDWGESSVANIPCRILSSIRSAMGCVEPCAEAYTTRIVILLSVLYEKPLEQRYREVSFMGSFGLLDL